MFRTLLAVCTIAVITPSEALADSLLAKIEYLEWDRGKNPPNPFEIPTNSRIIASHTASIEPGKQYRGISKIDNQSVKVNILASAIRDGELTVKLYACMAVKDPPTQHVSVDIATTNRRLRAGSRSIIGYQYDKRSYRVITVTISADRTDE